MKNPPQITSIALASVPILVLLLLVVMYAVNIPYWDQWDILYLFEKFNKSELDFSDFWRPHNEHRIVFPKIIFLILGILSGFDVRWEMLASIGLSILLYILIIRHMTKNRAILHLKSKDRIFWIIISFILFSLSQWENWLWGFQLQWYLNLLSVSLGGYIISNREINFSTIIMLSCCGIIATFSLSNGLLYWIIVLLLLIIYQIKVKASRGYYIIISWVIISGLVYFLYLFNLKNIGDHPYLFTFYENPLTFFSYIGRYIGSPLNFFGDPILKSILFGPLGILIFVLFSAYYIFQKNIHNLQCYFFFIQIGLYSILSAVLTAAGRSGLGVSQAESSRYISVSNFLWISVIYILLSVKRDFNVGPKFLKQFPKYTKLVMLAAVVVSINVKSYQSVNMFREINSSREYGQHAVVYETSLEGLKYLYPHPYRLLEHDIPLLKRLKLSVFNNKIPPIVVDIEPDSWNLEGGWTFNGIYSATVLEKKYQSRYILGSWSGDDRNTGFVRSKPIRIKHSALVTIPLIHGPDISHQKIGIKIETEPPIELFCDLNLGSQLWRLCQFDLSPYIGRNLTILAEDNGSDWGQWIGFAQPVLIKRDL